MFAAVLNNLFCGEIKVLKPQINESLEIEYNKEILEVKEYIERKLEEKSEYKIKKLLKEFDEIKIEQAIEEYEY